MFPVEGNKKNFTVSVNIIPYLLIVLFLCTIWKFKSTGISDWKLYINREYGFEIKYPAKSKPCKWKRKSTVFCKKLSLLSENEKKYGRKYKDKVLSDIYEIRYGIDILERAEDLTGNLPLKDRKKFNGVEFDFYVYWDGGLTYWAPTYYYVTEAKKKNKKIVIWINSFLRVKGYQPPERKKMEEVERRIIKRMLSTFKFTDNN